MGQFRELALVLAAAAIVSVAAGCGSSRAPAGGDASGADAPGFDTPATDTRDAGTADAPADRGTADAVDAVDAMDATPATDGTPEAPATDARDAGTVEAPGALDATGAADAAPDSGPTDTDELARQSVQLALAVTALIEHNNTCGFASLSVLGAPSFTGTLGGVGTRTATLPVACYLSFPAATNLTPDCNGSFASVQGTVAVTGTQTSQGHRTGDPTDSLWLDRTDGVTFDLTISFGDGFSVGTLPQLEVLAGTLAVRVKPEYVLSSKTGLCTIETPLASIEALAWQNAMLRLTTAQGTAAHAVSASMVSATRGASQAGTNLLAGTMTVDGVTRAVNGDGLGLDPGFSATESDQSWRCQPFLASSTPRACWPSPYLVANVARGLLRDAAFVVDRLDRDTTCGFDSASAAANAVVVTRPLSSVATETRAVDACAVTVPPTSVPDCVSSQDVAGSFTAGGTRTTTGTLTRNPAQPIIPTSRTGVQLGLTSATLTNVEVHPSGGGGSWLRASGTLAAQVTPVRGESASLPGAFTIRTPIMLVTSVTAPALSGTYRMGNGQANLALTEVTLSGRIGVYAGGGNDMQGSLTIDGVAATIPAGTQLDPDYQQAMFDASYACTPDLAGLVPTN